MDNWLKTIVVMANVAGKTAPPISNDQKEPHDVDADGVPNTRENGHSEPKDANQTQIMTCETNGLDRI
jgi:hypothetical protein